MNVGDTQCLDVIQACGNTLGGGGTGFNQAQELALMGDAGVFIHAQVTDMKLIDDGFGDGIIVMGI